MEFTKNSLDKNNKVWIKKCSEQVFRRQDFSQKNFMEKIWMIEKKRLTIKESTCYNRFIKRDKKERGKHGKHQNHPLH